MLARRLKRLVYLLISLVAIVGLAPVVGYLVIIRGAFPKLDGEITLSGLNAPTMIYRDGHGIPHIYAESGHDLFFAQGFVHAQDRLWQMEAARRAAQGRLSEIVGQRGLQNDKFMRTLGLTEAARADVNTLEADSQAALRAYAEGVNAFLAQAGNKLPLEFKILGFKPESWTPLDTLVFGKMLAWSLSSNYADELMITKLAARTSWKNVLDILPNYSGPTIIRDANTAALGRTSAGLLAVLGKLRAVTSLARPDQGSNDWVVNGSHTASGKPLLANDPHQSLPIPSLWYEVGLHTPDGAYDVVGGSLPSVPGIEIGHNARIAWGVTNARPDVQDLFIESFNAEGTQYQFRGQWEDLTTRRETIGVKKANPVTLKVRVTQHGPLVSDVLENADQALALRWTALDGRPLLPAILKLNRAQNWDQFCAAVQDWQVPALHFIYADVDGHIGYQLSGAIPIRADNDALGLVPVSGSDGAHEWTGFIPYDELPHDLDPAAGFYVTANNKPVGNGDCYFIARYWQPPYRAIRITETLRHTSNLTPADFEKLQADTYSALNRQIARTLARAVTTTDPVGLAALSWLERWNGEMTADSVAASVSEVALFHLIRETLRPALGDDGVDDYLRLAGYPYFYLQHLLDHPDSRWWQGDRSARINAAFAGTMKELKGKLGEDPAQWAWGRLHRVTFAHPLVSISLLRPIFNRGPFPAGGNWNTVNSGAYWASAPYAMAIGPAYRIINDLANWDNSRSVITTGESGQPFTAHYDDNLADWRAVKYYPLPFTRAAVKAAAVHILTLWPGH